MRLPKFPPLLFSLLFAFTFCCAPGSETGDTETFDYLRFQEEGPWTGRLETAIVTFENEAGVTVDLIAAVHLGDPEYYAALQFIFEKYDALLFELVTSDEDDRPATPGTREAEADVDLSMIGNLQRNLCRIMDLDYQIQALDYQKDNFVHADLTIQEFSDLWREKQESVWKLLLRSLTAQAKVQDQGLGSHLTPEAIMDALRSNDRSSRLKFLLAQEFQNIEAMLAFLEPAEEGETSVLLGERNKAALRTMEREIGKGKKKLAIFYGGGHMPDMERRLQQDMGFKKTRQRWMTAWEIRPKAD